MKKPSKKSLINRAKKSLKAEGDLLDDKDMTEDRFKESVKNLLNTRILLYRQLWDAKKGGGQPIGHPPDEGIPIGANGLRG